MFCIDDRIKSSSFILGEWPLSTVLLKNDASYPWFILVPRRMDIQEI
ncbi:HIT domain-containing protein, partial [Legionella pneumophila]